MSSGKMGVLLHSSLWILLATKFLVSTKPDDRRIGFLKQGDTKYTGNTAYTFEEDENGEHITNR